MASRKNQVRGDYSMAGTLRVNSPGNLRMDQTVRGSRGNVLSDELADQQKPRKAVILVTRPNGKILAVSRMDDELDMNMPGGGIEPGETPEDAARRELWEETGLVASDLVQIYSEGDVVAFRSFEPSGKLRSSEEGIARWVDPEEILMGSFSDFFKRMIKKITV